ncbi:hypothetical protein D9M69_425150 [compost metagenome]
MLQRFVGEIEQSHRDTGIGEIHGNDPTHRAGADYRDSLDLAARNVVSNTWNSCSLVLSQEHMAQCLGLKRDLCLSGQLCFPHKSLVQGQ